MTPEQQNIAIAEACGWILHDGRVGHEWIWLHGRPPPLNDHNGPPDFVSDLNAMAAAEKVLTPEQLERYKDILCDMVANDGNDPADICRLIFLTAANKAEAFVMATGRWLLTEKPF